MNLIEVIINSLLSHFYIVSFVSGFFGEEAILFLTFLANTQTVHLKTILLLAPLGVFAVDIIYFSLGKYGLIKKVGERVQNLEGKRGILPWIIRFSIKHPLSALIMTKFIYGTRIGLVMFYSSRKMSFKKFLVLNLIAIEIWAFIMIPLAWLAGRGLTSGLNLVKNFFKIVLIAILFIILIDLTIRIFSYFAKKEINHLNLR